MAEFDENTSYMNSDDEDYDRVNTYVVSSDESGSEDSIESDDQEDSTDKDAADGENKRISILTADEIRELEFVSEEASYDFYQRYARTTGFSVRKDEVKRDARGNVNVRQFVCSREGLRNKKNLERVDRVRDHRQLTRTKCPARLRMRYNAVTSRWFVKIFEESHNHELTPSTLVHINPAYRGLTDADKAQVDSLRAFGVRTCHIMGYMVAQKGGHAGAGFLRKDLYNYFGSKSRRLIKDGDVLAALSYLQGKADHDPMLYAKYSINRLGKLKHIFWADGCSINDFQCFGDVLAFDTTYRKNRYNFPLVIFSGCNHHSQTVIFGCALVSDETIETYKWVLEAFLEAMGNKQPKAVVTDGDGSMRESIKQVFPEATHRLCAWHLHKNAGEHVKIGPFLEDFKKAMYSNFTPEQFEEFWENMVDKHGVQQNEWVTTTYDNKLLWATAYFRDHFFARIRTTSQCEAINAIIKVYVKKKASIFEFMHNIEQALREYRNNELVADYKSLFTKPVLTTSLKNIEKDAAEIYTLEIFKEVKKQIVKAGALIVEERVEVEEKVTYKLNKYSNRASKNEVVYDSLRITFCCQCRLFESRGIPCSHIICAMKNEYMDDIPSSLVLTRWTKDAKKKFMSSYRVDDLDSDVVDAVLFGAYAAACHRFCKVATKKRGKYNEIMDDIFKLTSKYQDSEDPVSTERLSENYVGDPDVVKTKGAPRKNKFDANKRRCSNCSRTGHTKTRCPGRFDTEYKNTKGDDSFASECKESNISADSVSVDTKTKAYAEEKDEATIRPRQLNMNNKGKECWSDKMMEKKSKDGGSDKKKEKRAKDISNDKRNEKKAKNASCPSGGNAVMSQGESVVPMEHVPAYGYGTLGQGMCMLPSAVPVYPQHTQIPIMGQVPLHFGGVPMVPNTSSYFGLLQEMMKNESHPR